MSSSEFFSISSLNLKITRALWRGGFNDHSSNAFFAIITDWSKSDLDASLTSFTCSPVAGLNTFPFLSEVPEIIFHQQNALLISWIRSFRVKILVSLLFKY